MQPSLRISRLWLNTIAAMVCLLSVFIPWAVSANATSSDFASHYAAGELVRQHPGELYSLAVQREYQGALGAKKFLPWAHPALEAVLFVPLTMMQVGTAFRVWEALNLIALCGIALALRRYLGDLTGAQMGAVFAAAMIPLGSGLAAGQDHIFCVLLYTWAFLLIENGRDVWGGCIFGLTFVRFQLAIPILIFFLITKRWRVAGAAVATVVAMIAGSIALVGRTGIQDYRTTIVYLGMVHDAGSVTRMPCLRGLMGLAMRDPRELALATAVVSAVVLGIAAVWWARVQEFDLAFASALLLALAVDYHAFMYELSVVTLAGILAVRRCPRFAMWLWVMAAAEVVLVLLGGRFGLLAPMLAGAGWWTARAAQMREAPASECRPGLVVSP